MENKKELPEILHEWAEQIEATRQPYIRISSTNNPVENAGQSRLGGNPYWPIEMEYPTNISNKPVYLLAQINFEELPALAPFPSKGILQIFISDTPVYGMDYQLPQWQGEFRIVFHEELTAEGPDLVQDFSFLPEPEYFPMSWEEAYPLEFILTEGAAPPNHPIFIDQLGEDFFDGFGDGKWSVIATYRRYVQADGHKMGGYPHFPQEDPREEDQTPFLLLQLDSDTQTGLNWGDRGTAHFFMAPEDLLEKNFEKVFYTWSCY